ncbi:MAG: ABC-2 transporter permease [Nannocystaceae bacterium]
MFGLSPPVIRAIMRKELAAYLGNPTGYVFLTLFIATTAAAAFLQEGFFARNLADLAVLNQIMPPILMLFVPAITMNVWADERRSGTEELLLTLPVRDAEVVLGKYLGALGVYTVALGFSLAHLGVLIFLGAPDVGLMFATYLGYWLMGGLFVAVGVWGSMFSANATVGFILGGLGCSALVFAGAEPWASGLIGIALISGVAVLAVYAAKKETEGLATTAVVGVLVATVLWVGGIWPDFEGTFALVGVQQHFAGFGQGMIRFGDVLYFVGGTAFVLYLCGFLLGRRHW